MLEPTLERSPKRARIDPAGGCLEHEDEYEDEPQVMQEDAGDEHGEGFRVKSSGKYMRKTIACE